jgi:hypothetical protein
MFGKEEYQLVIEFSGDSSENFQKVIDLEMLLDAELKNGDVDGNDVGQGIINIFIITKYPDKCFGETMSHIVASSLNPTAAAYRPIEGEEYVRLWPEGDKSPFELK